MSAPPTATEVPLSAVARFERGTAALAVPHQGQFAAATLSFNLPKGKALGDAIDTVNQRGARPARAARTCAASSPAMRNGLSARWQRSRC